MEMPLFSRCFRLSQKRSLQIWILFAGIVSFNISNLPALTISSTSMTSQIEDGGVRLFFTVYVTNTSPPFKYEWELKTNGTVYITNTTFNSSSFSNTFSKLFGPFDVLPTDFYIGVTGLNNDFNGTSGGVPPPCGAICLSFGVPSTLSGTTGSGTNVAFSSSCGNFSAGSRWFRMGVLTNTVGIATVSTEGSSYNTVLGVYRGSISNPANLVPVTCSDNINSSNLQSLVSFQTQPNSNYWLVVNSPNAATLKLKYGYDLKFDTITRSNRAVEIRSSPVPSLQYQVLGATNLSTNPASWTVLLSTNFSTSTSASNNILRFGESNVLSNSRRFYRIRQFP